MHRTDAHALEAILREINDPSASNSLNARWKAALGVSPDQREFAKNHAEVVKLHDGVARYVEGLPPAARERYTTSLQQCWNLIVAPEFAWSSGIQGSLIGVEHVNILGSLGDVMEGRLQNTSSSPGGLDLASIKQQSEEWLELLPDAGLPVSTQALLEQAVEQLLWTIAHVDLFGLARVASDADRLTGALALSAEQVPDAGRAAWSERLKRWAGTLILFTGLMTATHGALESAGEVIKELTPVVQSVVQVVNEADPDEGNPPPPTARPTV